MPSPSSRKQRTDSDYEIDALAKGMKVLEALHDCAIWPIPASRVKLRTGLPYDFCMRALKTLKLAGYVAEVEGGWKLTPRLNRVTRNSEIPEFSKTAQQQIKDLPLSQV